VTVNGIKTVIDCGYVKESEYDSKRGITVMNTELID
jgi:HrpA-like RNA helicase